MQLYISFDKSANPTAAVELSTRFFDQVVGSAVRYQNQAITEKGVHWLVSATDAHSLKERIERVVGDEATVTIQNENGITIVPK